MNTYYFSVVNKGLAFLMGLLLLASANSVLATSMKEVSEHPMGQRSINSVRAVNERTQPVGKVCLEGETCVQESAEQVATPGGTAPQAAVAAKAPRDAAQVVQTSCFSCHGTGAAGAPVIGQPIWKTLESEKGLDGLLQSAINGKGAMPPKGLCMDCSDDEIKAAIEYILAQ